MAHHTRFSPKKIQRQSRYFDAMVAKIIGSSFEDDNYGKLERYNRLASINSQENKESLIEMLELLSEKGCNNVVIRVTADKNDFELLIFEKSKAAAFCFHDLSKQDVVHSCMITRDTDIFSNFSKLYQKLWSEDALMEIDFSLGRKHVEEQIGKLKNLEPIQKNNNLSPLESIIYESQLKIKACNTVKNSGAISA